MLALAMVPAKKGRAAAALKPLCTLWNLKQKASFATLPCPRRAWILTGRRRSGFRSPAARCSPWLSYLLSWTSARGAGGGGAKRLIFVCGSFIRFKITKFPREKNVVTFWKHIIHRKMNKSIDSTSIEIFAPPFHFAPIRNQCLELTGHI